MPASRHLHSDALLQRIRADISELRDRHATADLTQLLQGELEELKIEELAATPGGIDRLGPDAVQGTLSDKTRGLRIV
jgi:hypothetical protein